jgi:hypothetical protein
MAFQFSRHVSILPGLKLDFNGSGVPLSAGLRGADTISDLPGIRLSYRQHFCEGRVTTPELGFSEEESISIGDRPNDEVEFKLFQKGTQNLPLRRERIWRFAGKKGPSSTNAISEAFRSFAGD